ncbi:SCO family protein [Thalassotalea fusca]
MIKKHLTLSFVIFCILSGIYFLVSPLLKPYANESPPRIQGVLLQTPVALPRIDLINHYNELVTQDAFKGSWSVISYGYTHCPDVCPLLLVTLTEVETELRRIAPDINLAFYFYTVDPLRDNVARLKQYVPYFSSTFVGLRAISASDKDVFEESLGIQSVIDIPDTNDLTTYTVGHSQSIFLVNPNGALQAVLLPMNRGGVAQPFNSEQLVTDVTSIIHHYPQI